MRDAKGLVRVTVLAGLALMTASSAVRIAVAQEKGGGDVTGPYDYVSDWPLPLHADGWTWGLDSGGVGRVGGSCLRLHAREAGDESRTGARYQRIARLIARRRPRAGSPAGPADEHVLMVFNRTGELIDSWAQNKDLFTEGAAHRVQIDLYDHKHVWLVEHLTHQILKFTNDD